MSIGTNSFIPHKGSTKEVLLECPLRKRKVRHREVT